MYIYKSQQLVLESFIIDKANFFYIDFDLASVLYFPRTFDLSAIEFLIYFIK